MSTEESQAKPARKPIRHKQIAEAIDALRALDATEGKESRKPLYHFDPGVRVALSRRLRKLVEISEDIDAEKKAKLIELGLTGEVDEGGKPKDDPNAQVAAQRWWSDLMDAPIESIITFDNIPYKWLLGPKEKNDLPIGLLTALDPFLVDLPADPA
jgi:hypothetical protein